MIGESMRDEKGRFQPGRSGNPLGKRKGTRNRKSVLLAALREGEAEAMARHLIEQALAGDAIAARFCVDRLMPRRRGAPIRLDLPEGARCRDPGVAFDATLAAMAAGEVTPEEALLVVRVLAGKRLLGAKPQRTPKEPSPACGRGQGEGGLGSTADAEAAGDAEIALTPTLSRKRERGLSEREMVAPEQGEQATANAMNSLASVASLPAFHLHFPTPASAAPHAAPPDARLDTEGRGAMSDAPFAQE